MDKALHMNTYMQFEILRDPFLVYNCYKIILSDLCHEVDFLKSTMTNIVTFLYKTLSEGSEISYTRPCGS